MYHSALDQSEYYHINLGKTAVSELQEETHKSMMPVFNDDSAPGFRERDEAMTPLLPRIEELEEVKFTQSEVVIS